MKSISVIILLMLSARTFAQSPESIQQEAMKKLGWWIGEWRGTAIAKMGPGKSDTISMTESIKTNLDGTIILIEGIGYLVLNKSIGANIVHHAYAVVSFDEKALKYRWQSWRIPGGLYTDHQPEISDNSISWGMDIAQGKMKYHVRLTENGDWLETGEFSRDGQNWFDFFDMLLMREK